MCGRHANGATGRVGPKVAWGDESVRIAAPTPTYLLGTCILGDKFDCSGLEKLPPKGASKLHWRDLTDSLKGKSLKAVAEIEQQTLLIAAAPLPKKKQERARRKCLEALLPKLESMGVDKLALETRQAQKDRMDVEMYLAMKTRGAVSRIDIEHRGAACEPRLWLPDLVVGMYRGEMCGNLSKSRWQDPWNTVKSSIMVLETRL